MLMIVVATAFGALGWLFARSNYRGIIQDLRGTLEYERKMRKHEEDRAEMLSDAFFGRTKTRQRPSTEPQN